MLPLKDLYDSLDKLHVERNEANPELVPQIITAGSCEGDTALAVRLYLEHAPAYCRLNCTCVAYCNVGNAQCTPYKGLFNELI